MGKLATPRKIKEGLAAATAIAAEEGFAWERIICKRRHKKLVHVRWRVCKALHDAGLSTVTIGMLLNRDHSTIVHGLQKMRQGVKVLRHEKENEPTATPEIPRTGTN